MRIEIQHKFGPHISHYRVVKCMELSVSECTAVMIVKQLNKVFQVKTKGKTIFPSIGQKYAVYTR